MAEQGYDEKWVVYGNMAFCAKELTVFPGQTVNIKDTASYGLIMMQGYGIMNDIKIETLVMIRFGQLTADELFVSEQAAQAGVRITNNSETDNNYMSFPHGTPAV